jgi:endonuclease-3
MAPADQLVSAYLQWNATRKQAQTAYGKLTGSLVDLNDIRVSLPGELVDAIGPRYPRVEERVARLRDALQSIYLREHGMHLKSLEGKAKKDVRAYLDALPGMVPFVAAYVMLFSYGAHAIPVDDRIAELLKKHDAIDADAGADDIAGFLERRIKAADAEQTFLALRAWADADGKLPATRTKKRTTRKKTTTTKKKAIKKKK